MEAYGIKDLLNLQMYTFRKKYVASMQVDMTKVMYTIKRSLDYANPVSMISFEFITAEIRF